MTRDAIVVFHVVPFANPSDVRTFVDFADAWRVTRSSSVWAETSTLCHPMMDIDARGHGHFRYAPHNTVAHTPPYCEQLKEKAREAFRELYEEKMRYWGAYWAQKGIGQ